MQVEVREGLALLDDLHGPRQAAQDADQRSGSLEHDPQATRGGERGIAAEL